MLTINLLPTQKRPKVANIEKQAALFVLSLVLILVAIFLLQNKLAHRVQALENKKDSHLSTLQELQPQIDKIKEIKDTLKEIKNKLEVIKKIRTKQSLPIQYLNNMVQKLPEDKILFDSLRMSSQGNINLTGVAMDNQAFASYVKKLKLTPFVGDINIKKTSRRQIKNLNFVSFNCLIKSKPPEKNSTKLDDKNG